MSCVYDTQVETDRVRYYTMLIFGYLYTLFTIMLGTRLNSLNNDSTGRYDSSLKVVSCDIEHSVPYQLYVAVSSFYVCLLMLIAGILLRRPGLRLSCQKLIVTACTLEFIVHLGAVVTSKIHNEPLLDDAAIENKWGFGQVVAMMMLLTTLLECAKGFEGKLTFA